MRCAGRLTPRDPLASPLAQLRSPDAECRGVGDGGPIDAPADGGGHCGRTSNRHACVVGHSGGIRDKINKGIKIAGGDDQSNWSDPHCSPVGRSKTSHLIEWATCDECRQCRTARRS